MTWRDIFKLGEARGQGKCISEIRSIHIRCRACRGNSRFAGSAQEKEGQTKTISGGPRGTPAPIAGTGLVGVAVAGGVTYLLWRRRRKPDQH